MAAQPLTMDQDAAHSACTLYTCILLQSDPRHEPYLAAAVNSSISCSSSMSTSTLRASMPRGHARRIVKVCKDHKGGSRTGKQVQQVSWPERCCALGARKSRAAMGLSSRSAAPRCAPKNKQGPFPVCSHKSRLAFSPQHQLLDAHQELLERHLHGLTTGACT